MTIPKTKITVGLVDTGCTTKPSSMVDIDALFELTGLQGGKKCARFQARDVIYNKGDRIDRIYMIRTGVIKLLSYMPNGRGRITRLYVNDGWLGVEGLLQQSYEHTAVAIEDSEIISFSRHSLQLLERDNPRQYCRLLQIGYVYLAEADRWISEFSTGEIKPRVARLLAFLSQLEYGESAKAVELLTVHEMADMLGVTPESVSRILAQFKRDKILYKLQNSPDKIYALNRPRLQYEACQ